jgi:hypothetical protein
MGKTTSDGSTIDKGIEDANVPDITGRMEDAAQVSILTPLGDPTEDKCIWGAPACFWGLPAVAKSESIKQAAFAAGLGCGIVMPGQRQPEDFSGVLISTPDGNVRSECLLGAVRLLNAYGAGVLFLDEFSNAPPATQGSMLDMVNDRQCGDTPIAPKVRILSAANPAEYSAGGFRLDPPMANRMCHFQVKCPPVEKFINFLVSEGSPMQVDVLATEALIQAHWAEAYAKVKGLMVGFLHSNHRMLHVEPHPTNPQSSYCWASPRTWWLAGRMRATANILGKDTTVQELIIEACIGKAAADTWMAWERNSDLPTPEDALDGKWVPDIRRLDVSYAVITSCTQFTLGAVDKQLKIERAKKMWTLLGKFVDANLGDLAIPSVKALISKGMSLTSMPEVINECRPVYNWVIDNGIIKFAKEI